MDTRIFHGNVSPSQIATALIAQFNRGNFMVQQLGSGSPITVQIATRNIPAAGGQTALCVALQKTEDSVMVQLGQQAWLGVAASFGLTALSALRNPFSLLGRLDDLAQDIESLQLTEEVWRTINAVIQAAGAGYELSENLRRTACEYCGTANPVGEPRCLACGAPLGKVQPVACKKCGFVISHSETTCPNCWVAIN